MTRIFINLPVANLARSIAFYEAVGAVRDRAFPDDNGAMLAFSDAIAITLLPHDRVAQFTDRTLVDPRTHVQVGLTMSVDSRADLDARIAAAVQAGGAADPDPVPGDGPMYGRSFADPDGHVWDLCWMDVTAETEQA